MLTLWVPLSVKLTYRGRIDYVVITQID